MKNVKVWSRSRLFLSGAEADPILSEAESAPGPRTYGAGAAKKSGGSATLIYYYYIAACAKKLENANITILLIRILVFTPPAVWSSPFGF